MGRNMNPYNAGFGGLADRAIRSIVRQRNVGVQAIDRLYAVIGVLETRLQLVEAENVRLRNNLRKAELTHYGPEAEQGARP